MTDEQMPDTVATVPPTPVLAVVRPRPLIVTIAAIYLFGLAVFDALRVPGIIDEVFKGQTLCYCWRADLKWLHDLLGYANLVMRLFGAIVFMLFGFQVLAIRELGRKAAIFFLVFNTVYACSIPALWFYLNTNNFPSLRMGGMPTLIQMTIGYCLLYGIPVVLLSLKRVVRAFRNEAEYAHPSHPQ
jgi:hypothetical protein